MVKWLGNLLWVSIAVALLCPAQRAQAQFYRPPYFNPYMRPTFSPYLNLLRPGTPAFLNYYGLVRPELQTMAGLNYLGQQGLATQQGIASLTTTFNGPLITGTRAGFMTQGRYFQNQNLGGGGRFGTTGIGAAGAGRSTAGALGARGAAGTGGVPRAGYGGGFGGGFGGGIR